MSVELNTYVASADAIIVRDLVSRLETKGWHVRFVDVSTLVPFSDGSLPTCLAIASRVVAAHDGLALDAIAAHNEPELDRLFAEGRLTSCCVTVTPRTRFEGALRDPDVQREIERAKDVPMLRSALAAANTRYDTETHAGRNKDATALQETLCLAIASIDGGVIEDPMFGAFRLLPASAAVPDPLSRWQRISMYARVAVGLLTSLVRG